MKKLVLLLLLCPTLLFAATSKIKNCESIASSGFILSNTIPGAYFYEFELTNLNSGQMLVVTSQGPSASLNLFSSIITYNSAYKVRVRAAISNERDPDFTEWSKICEFNIKSPPKYIEITNIDCDQTLRMDEPIYCTEFLNASCYTFTVTNLSTAQTASTGCITNNYFTLSSINLTLNPGDIIDILVSYSINNDVIQENRPCRYVIGRPRNLCHTIQIVDLLYGTGEPGIEERLAYSTNIGNMWTINYMDNAFWSNLAPAPWTGEHANMVSVLGEVLLDLENFLIRNSLDPDCGHPSQRWSVSLTPYLQYWVDNNMFSGAYAVAGQSVYSEAASTPNSAYYDINYLSDGCAEVPNVQLGLVHGNYGSSQTLDIGGIFINPSQAFNNPTFNYNSSLAEWTFPEPDLYTIFLHEMLHILGIDANDFKFGEMLYSNGTPLNNPGLLDCGQAANYNTLATAGCTNVYFHQTDQEVIHAPSQLTSGSLEHFVDFCGSNTYGENVMHPDLLPGETKRCLHQREVNALQYLGYNVNSSFGQCTNNYTTNNTPYIIGNHDGLTLQADPYDGYNCNYHTYNPIVHNCGDTWPMNLSPLDNDINATFIDEAVVITGNSNATLINNGTSLDFTASLPGIYTIEYIPANPNRIGLPTYIQIWVPSCGDQDLVNVTCNNLTTCNQICFGSDINEHTICRGSGLTNPEGFNGPENQFEFSSVYSPSIFGIPQDVFSSVFFWVDTDINQEYSISYDRQFTDFAWASSPQPDPDVEMYIYLVKSSDMIGEMNQSNNSFNLPSNHQLILKERFNYLYNNTGVTYGNISTCFTADDEYDMLVFKCQQVNNTNFGFQSRFRVQNLEFMEKEFPTNTTLVSSCLPGNLNLGTPFCVLPSNSYTWTELSSGTIVGTNQTYNAGSITSQLIDQYTLTMNYPNLPQTVLLPTDNSICSESHSFSVVFDDCCTNGSVPLYHPLTGNSTVGRSFGNDVDSDNNGSLYYSGQTTTNLQFGNLALNQTNGDIGFVMKIKDNCAEWIVPKSRGNIELEVSNNGRVFYSTRYNDYSVDEIGELDPITGATLWNWTVPGNMNYITDFDVNNLTQELIITGQVNSSLLYGGVQIYSGTGTKIFMIKVDFNGLLQSTYITPAVSGSYNKYGYACIDEINSDIFLAYNSSDNDITIRKFDYTNVSTSIPDEILTSSTFSHITSTDINNNSLVIQIAHDQDIYDGGVLLSTAAGLTVTALKSLNTNLQTSLFSSNSWGGSFQYMYGITADRPDMHIEGNEVFQTFTDGNGDLVVSSRYLNSSILNWSDFSSSQTTNPFRGTRGIKSTNLGLFTTGSFVVPLDLNGNIIYPDLTGGPGTYTASFYGIKYDGTGNITTMALNNDNNQSASSNNSKSQLSTSTFEEKNQKINIYPNPSKDIFSIEVEGEFQVQVLDLNGRTIMSFNTINQSRFDLTNYSSGIYQVVFNSETVTETFKIIKLD